MHRRQQKSSPGCPRAYAVMKGRDEQIRRRRTWATERAARLARAVLLLQTSEYVPGTLLRRGTTLLGRRACVLALVARGRAAAGWRRRRRRAGGRDEEREWIHCTKDIQRMPWCKEMAVEAAVVVNGGREWRRAAG